MKNEDDPFYFSISALKKEPVCRRCREKMEVVKRLNEQQSEEQHHHHSHEDPQKKQ